MSWSTAEWRPCRSTPGSHLCWQGWGWRSQACSWSRRDPRRSSAHWGDTMIYWAKSFSTSWLHINVDMKVFVSVRMHALQRQIPFESQPSLPRWSQFWQFPANRKALFRLSNNIKTNMQSFTVLITIWLIFKHGDVSKINKSQEEQVLKQEIKQSCFKSKLSLMFILTRLHPAISWNSIQQPKNKLHAQATCTVSFSAALSMFRIAGVSRSTSRAGTRNITVNQESCFLLSLRSKCVHFYLTSLLQERCSSTKVNIGLLLLLEQYVP